MAETRIMELDYVHMQSEKTNGPSSILRKRKLKSETKDVDLMQWQSERTISPSSTVLLETLLHLEPSIRWIGRLKHKSSDPILLARKNPELGYHPSCRKISSLLHEVPDGNRSSSDHERMVMLPTDAQGSQGVPAKCMSCWVRRFCANHSETVPDEARKLSEQQCELQKSDISPGSVRGRRQIASFAAMATVGKAMNKLRPHELQRRGPFVVWSTNGGKEA